MGENLPSGRLAFFDFDRTLVAHRYSAEYVRSRADSYYLECLYMLTQLEAEHKNDRPLPCMQWYANMLQRNGCRLYVLTHEIFNLRDSLKKKQLEKFYPGMPMTYLTVDVPEHKVDMMRAVAASEGCSLSDVLFVDDRQETVNAALAAGIMALHLSDVVTAYEYVSETCQQGVFMKPTKTLSDVLSPNQPLTPDECMDSQDLSDDGLDDVYEQCRQLAEMNGRGSSPMPSMKQKH